MSGGSLGRALGALVLAVAATSARAEVIHVTIKKLGFVPAQVSAHVGDTIEWTNTDFLLHTATARNGAFNVPIPANSKGRTVVKAAGTVDYYCTVHPNMTGQIVVSK
jgi:plastocyanin